MNPINILLFLSIAIFQTKKNSRIFISKNISHILKTSDYRQLAIFKPTNVTLNELERNLKKNHSFFGTTPNLVYLQFVH